MLFQPLYLLRFCFENLDLSAIQLTHLDLYLITLFVIITFFEPILYVCFLQPKQYVCMFYNDSDIFLTITLNALILLNDLT